MRIGIKELARFCEVSTRSLYRAETDGIIGAPDRDGRGWRSYTIEATCDAYRHYHHDYPSGSDISSLLFEAGVTDVSKVKVIIMRLKSEGRVKNSWV